MDIFISRKILEAVNSSSTGRGGSCSLPEWLEQGLSDASAEERATFERTYFEEVRKTLKEIAESDENWLDQGVPVGQPKRKIGPYSVPVKELLMVGLAYSLPVTIAISALVTGPPTLVLAAKAASAIAPMAAKYVKAVKTYDPIELDVIHCCRGGD